MRGQQVHHQPDMHNYHHPDVVSPIRGHHNQLVTSPVRGQHHMPVSPGPEAMGHMGHHMPVSPGPEAMGQMGHHLSPHHNGQMSPHMLSPIKPVPQSVVNNLSPTFHNPVVSPHKKEEFIDNNPGFYNNNVNNHNNQLWSPGMAITPAPPQFDDCYPQPAASSSLYGQDLRYTNPYY